MHFFWYVPGPLDPAFLTNLPDIKYSPGVPCPSGRRVENIRISFMRKPRLSPGLEGEELDSLEIFGSLSVVCVGSESLTSCDSLEPSPI